MKTEKQMQAQLDKSGAVLLNGVKGRVVVWRSRIDFIAEINDGELKTRIYYKDQPNHECINVKDSFDDVIDKIYF